ncbi:MAG: serine hydrolase domain-containing protein [Chloroflexota bacterium]
MTASLTRAGTDTVRGQNLEYLDAHLQKYIDAGKLTGTLTAVYHRGQLAHWRTQGLADRERNTPVRDDTIFRIYSMTKPIVSVALMQLYERGLLQIDDPVHKYIPSWEGLRVYQSGTHPTFATTPCERPMTVRDLLSHQAGLTYGFASHTNVDAAYRQLSIGRLDVASLADFVERLSGVPLDFSPGTAWNYSHATDIVGYLVEVISGQPLDVYLQEQIFKPLGMVDTGFSVSAQQASRFASNYAGDKDGSLNLVDDAGDSAYLRPPAMLSGGGGLVATAGDYLRFCQMLLGKGTLEGARIIGRKTLELMTRNHITGGKTIAEAATAPRWRENPQQGTGFGLGFAVTLDPAVAQVSTSPGTYYWSGAASTHFWIDPVEDLAVVFMTQYMTLSSETRLNLAREVRAIVYGALE